MTKLERMSHRYVIMFRLISYFVLIGMVLFWAIYMTPYDIFSKYGFGLSEGYATLSKVPLSPITRLFGFIVSMIPCTVIFYGLNQLIKLFNNYQKGEVFTLLNVNIYKKLAYSLYAWIIAGIIYDALISLVLSFNNPPGHRVIMISFQTPDIVALIAGTIVLIISYVMHEALNISEDNKLTI